MQNAKRKTQNYNSKLKTKLLLFGILGLAAFLRLNQLTTLPALNADEAAVGYNVYSLLETGRDEHGNAWPIHFQSFNDYKPGLYFYIVMPFVKVLGLTELAVRLPGALMGVGTVWLVYLLVGELFRSAGPAAGFLPASACVAYRALKRVSGSLPPLSPPSLALLAALFLAISPWHLQFSRGGWEVNAATFFITLGVWSFLKGLNNKRWFFVSSVAFVASLYTYHAARVVVPLLVLGLVIVYRDKVLLPFSFACRKLELFSLLAGVVLLIPLAVDFLGSAGLSRASGVGLVSDTGPLWRVNQQRGEHGDFTGLAAVLLHNKPVNYALAFLENYTEHFWGEFLFLSGDDIQRNKVPEMGQMYLFDLLFVAVGFVAIARRRAGWELILVWLFVAPVAAALTFQSPHALRAQNMVVPLVIISAYGAATILGFIKNKVRSKWLFVICCLLLVTFVVWDFSRYLHQYYVHMAKTYDFSSQYGVRELVEFVKSEESKFDEVYVTDRYDQPYILFLFYLQYPPGKFQKEHGLTGRDEFGFSTVRGFGKYRFEPIDWNTMRDLRRVALVGTEEELPPGANATKIVEFPSGRVAFKFVPL